jgi:hypothetical protein
MWFHLLPPVPVLIAGNQKCGTSALHAMLAHHSQLKEPLRRKELHFFDAIDELKTRQLLKYGLEWPLQSAFDGTLRFESTPIYLWWKNPQGRSCMDLIREYNPQIKLILMFRDPVERAHSNWNMLVQKGKIKLKFSEAIQQELDREVGDLDRHLSFLSRGRYDVLAERALELFPAEQLLFVLQENLRDEPEATLNRIQRFLNVSPEALPILEVHRRPYASSIDEADRILLNEHFRDSSLRFGELTGCDLRVWPSLASSE